MTPVGLEPQHNKAGYAFFFARFRSIPLVIISFIVRVFIPTLDAFPVSLHALLMLLPYYSRALKGSICGARGGGS